MQPLHPMDARRPIAEKIRARLRVPVDAPLPDHWPLLVDEGREHLAGGGSCYFCSALQLLLSLLLLFPAVGASATSAVPC